jgi:hypothetical protein
MAGAFAARAFLVAIVAGGVAVETFGPVQGFVGQSVGAGATLPGENFAATTIGNFCVVTNAATFCAACNW